MKEKFDYLHVLQATKDNLEAKEAVLGKLAKERMTEVESLKNENELGTSR